MRRVTAQVHLLHHVRMANVWVMDTGDARFIVDSSHFLERPLLRRALWNAGIRGRGDVQGIILTHRHSDHAGNAAWLRKTLDAPVFCHADDAPSLTGATPPPPLAPRGTWPHERLLGRVEDLLPARSPVDDVFEEGTWRHGFRAIHVPGHTEGSAMLHHEGSATLFSGDAILAGPAPQRLFESMRLAMPGFSLDVERCHRETRRFLRDLPRTETLCSGHGPPVREDVERKLRAL